jgi:hypothetical protein
MLTAIVLTALAVLCRLSSPVFLTWNFVPMGAVALYAGAKLPRRWAWLVPLASVILSDLVLDFGKPRPLFELTRWTVYGTLAATTLLGQFANLRKVGRWLLPFLSLGGSMLFFLTTNLATWAEGRDYPLTLPGLVACYAAGIEFLRNTVMADFLGTAVLFGLGPVFERAFHKLTQNRVGESLAEVEVANESQAT